MLKSEEIKKFSKENKIIENFYKIYIEIYNNNKILNKESIFNKEIENLLSFYQSERWKIHLDLASEIKQYFNTNYSNYNDNITLIKIYAYISNNFRSQKGKEFLITCFTDTTLEKKYNYYNIPFNNNVVNSIDSVFRNFIGMLNEEIPMLSDLINVVYKKYEKNFEKYFQALGHTSEQYLSQGTLTNLANNYFKKNSNFDFCPLNSLKQNLEEIKSLNLNKKKIEVDSNRIATIQHSVIKRNSHIQIGKYIATVLNEKCETKIQMDQTWEITGEKYGNVVNNTDSGFINPNSILNQEIPMLSDLINVAYKKYEKNFEKYFQALGHTYEQYLSQGTLTNLANNYFKKNSNFDFCPLNSLKQNLEEIKSLNLNKKKIEVDSNRIATIQHSVIKRNSHIQIGEHVAIVLNKQTELQAENEKQILFEELPFSDFSQ